MKIGNMSQIALGMGISLVLILAGGCSRPYKVLGYEGAPISPTPANERKVVPSPTPSRLDELGDYLHYVEIDSSPETEKIRNAIQEEEPIDTSIDTKDTKGNKVTNRFFIPKPPPPKEKQKGNDKPLVEPGINLPPERGSSTKQDSQKNESVKNQAVDYHSQGHLQHPTSIVDLRNSLGEDSPFEVLNRTVAEKRFYATEDLVNYIYFIAQFLRSSFSDKKILVADLSLKRGGPICCKRDSENKILYRDGAPVLSHVSHQNGLDADLAYISKGENRFISLRDGAMAKLLDFEAQKKIFLQAMKSDQIEFILVYPDLKKALCLDAYREGVFDDLEKHSDSINMLTHIVPDAAHHDHFHLRLKCDPKIHPLCKTSEGEEPLKHGCVFKNKIIK